VIAVAHARPATGDAYLVNRAEGHAKLALESFAEGVATALLAPCLQPLLDQLFRCGCHGYLQQWSDLWHAGLDDHSTRLPVTF
jgi:hypothetical protein